MRRNRRRKDGIMIECSWIVWNDNHSEDPIKCGYKNIIHHKDFNHSNDDINNLQKMTDSEHKKLHNSGKNHYMYGKNMSKETIKKMSIVQRGNKNHRSRAVIAEYMIFSTGKEAAKVLSVVPSVIICRIRKNKPGYLYLE